MDLSHENDLLGRLNAVALLQEDVISKEELEFVGHKACTML